MRKILLLSLIISASLLNAQTTIFQENWDGQGPGISAWTLYNVDNKIPVGPSGVDGEPLSYLIQDAWNVLSPADIEGASPGYTYPTAATGMAGNIIASNSWYTPAGIANDWLVSPQIIIPAGATNVNLTWSATSLGATAYLEDYKVYISTTGNQVSNFTTILQTVTNEPNTGNARTVNISSYAGQTVRIAFRNDSNDQYVMFLDNIKIAGNNVLGTSDVTKKHSTISPNPTSDILNIKTDSKINNVSVVDITGRKVSVKLDGDKVDVRTLPSGTYLINVETKEGISTEKFIKK